MTDIPIIFSAPMVRALLREVDDLGTGKTMTRRLAWQEVHVLPGNRRVPRAACVPKNARPPRVDHVWVPSPWQKAKPGDRLWVRESWGDKDADAPGTPDGRKPQCGDCINYMADPGETAQWGRGLPSQGGFVWRPSIHLPRWASRLTLVVTETKIERLRDISEQDCEREGLRWKNGLWRCPAPDGGDWHATEKAIDCWRWLWTKLHGEESWRENPEVVVLGFSVHKVNVDAMKEAA